MLRHAFHIEKIKSPAGIERTLLRQRAHRSKSQRRTLVHLFGGAAEDRAQLKQTHLANVAIQVARNHRQHAGYKRRAQHACFFAERIAKWNYLPGLRRSQRGFRRGAEGAANRLMKPGGQQRAAYRGFLLRPRQRAHAFAEFGQRVGKAVVTVNARHLFDEIDLAFEIEPPTGQRRPATQRLFKLTAATAGSAGFAIRIPAPSAHSRRLPR